jgi:uracil-DNA glycosylase
VKHYKFQRRETQKISKRPSGDEVTICKPWLLKERELLTPNAIICFGQTAALSILGQVVKIQDCQDRCFEFDGIPVYVTYDPSTLLRQSESKRTDSLLGELRDLLLRVLSTTKNLPYSTC